MRPAGRSHARAEIAAGRPAVLVTPEHVGAAAPVAAGPYTRRGSTANFDVAYDSSLGASGKRLADAVLARCEQDYAQLQAWFGGIRAGRFSVLIDPGSFGAYHATCAATELHLAAFAGNDGQLANLLNVAEADEVFMAVQNAGWDCGGSNGEGLSRVLAAERYPASLDGFASASRWLDSPRPDWVSRTEPSDRNFVSIGCSTLFLNYLRHQLGFGWDAIVQAGGATLAQAYSRLTGATPGTAFGPFAALLARRFPPGMPSGLAGDNPFPLLYELLQVVGVTDDGRAWYSLRRADGTWSSPFDDVKARAGDPGRVLAGAGAGLGGDLHLVLVTQDGGLWHAVHPRNGSWQGFVDVRAAAGNPGRVVRVAASAVAGRLQLVCATDAGGLFHSARQASGTWQRFADVKAQAGSPGRVSAVGTAEVQGALHLVCATDAGGLSHTAQAAGSWSQFQDVKSLAGDPGPVSALGCAGVNRELQLVAVTGSGGAWHSLQRGDQSWQRFADVKAAAGNPGHISSAACAAVNGELQLVVTTDDGGLWHSIRSAGGAWKSAFADVRTVAGNPGRFASVAGAGVG